jgi:hypothetical protein
MCLSLIAIIHVIERNNNNNFMGEYSVIAIFAPVLLNIKENPQFFFE